jgi:hypothetical protein
MKQMNVVETGDYRTFTAAGSTNELSKGPTDLIGVICSSGTTPTIQIHDGLTTSGAVAVPTITLPIGFTPMPIRLRAGLSVTVGGTSPNVTVVFDNA